MLNMKSMSRIVVFSALALQSIAYSGEIRIAAAASMQGALTELVRVFEAGHPDCTAEPVFASSGKLVAQILNGAPFDLFLAADMESPRMVDDKGAARSRPVVYAIGRLALWSTSLELPTFDDLTGDSVRHLAIANPRLAPYGARAMEVMEKLGILGAVSNKLVYGENIAQTAHFVESGAAEAGFVALSLLEKGDERASGHWALVKSDLHQPIEHGMVALAGPGDFACADAFAAFLVTQDAQAILERFGFSAPETAGGAP